METKYWIVIALVVVLLLVSTTDDGIICASFVPYTETNIFFELKLWVTAIDDVVSNDAVTVATWDTSDAGKFVNELPSPANCPLKEPLIVPSPNVFKYLESNEDVNWDEPETIPVPPNVIWEPSPLK